MIKVEVVKVNEIEIKPFEITDFVQKYSVSEDMTRVSKKELRALAKDLGLDYNGTNIDFSKRLMNEYIKRNKRNR